MPLRRHAADCRGAADAAIYVVAEYNIRYRHTAYTVCDNRIRHYEDTPYATTPFICRHFVSPDYAAGATPLYAIILRRITMMPFDFRLKSCRHRH